MRKHTLVSRLTTRFTFIELALRRVPIFTRRSRAGKFQIISTRLSKNGPIVTFASDTSLPRRTSTSWRVWLGWRGGSVLWCLCTILGFVTETASVGLRTLAFFLSTGNRYFFLLQRRLIPFDSWSLLLIQFSHVWRQSFVIEVSDPYSSLPLSSISENWEPIFSDESPCRTIPILF